ncbi:MAG: DUF4136 domain-containing protein [Ferruginibacter sp.]
MKNALKTGFLPLLASAFFLMSCGSTAHIEKDETVNFSEYKTYAWETEAKGTKKDHSNDFVESTIKQAVNQQLSKNTSWKQVDKNPDLILSYDLLVDKNVNQQSDPVYSQPYTRTFYNPYSRRFVNVYYPSRFLGYDRYDVPVNEGTVSISMIDTKTDKTVWQGWTSDQIDSRKFKSSEAESAVRSIFKKFDLAKN